MNLIQIGPPICPPTHTIPLYAKIVNAHWLLYIEPTPLLAALDRYGSAPDKYSALIG